MLQRLLLLPLLSPLLLTLLVAALNPRPSVVLRLLTWQTPSLPIGLWMAMAAGGGAALSGGATALALGQGMRQPLRRTVRRREVWDIGGSAEEWSSPRGGGPEPESREAPSSHRAGPGAAAAPAAAGPTRAAGDPAPTVSVPYRVLHRPDAAAGAPFRPAAPSRPSPAAPAMANDAGDWGEAESEEW
ncbi:MAG: hypothetical protein ER33_03965 [Cyanobium sp. CACIAM 14]|nr:MAG: hypothetical protein ER33_03965 [Cyanobium sp. CACIAM 14]